MMSKIWTNWDTIILLSRKHCGEKGEIARSEQFLLFPRNVFKSCLLLMRQNDYLWNKGVYCYVLLISPPPLSTYKDEII